MTSENFCYWLQGLFELDTSGVILKNGLSKEQTDLIHRHLKMVFYHEIDPSFGDKQETLQKIHDGIKQEQNVSRPYREYDDRKIKC